MVSRDMLAVFEKMKLRQQVSSIVRPAKYEKEREILEG